MVEPPRALLDELTTALASTRTSALPTAALDVLRTDPAVTSARIWLLDVAGDTLTDIQDPGSRVSVSDTAAGRAALDDSAMVTGDTALIPLSQRGHVLGILEVCGADAASLVTRMSPVATLLAEDLIGSLNYGDSIERLRRSHELSVSATIQYTLLPLLGYRDETVELTGRLEPAYDVAGDLYDYAVNPEGVHIAMFDAVGHDLRSTTLSVITAGAYRRGRRSGDPLATIAEEIDATIQSFDRDIDFVTGLVGRLELTTGRLDLWNAGHVDPLIVRDSKVLTLSPSQRCRPFGLGPLEGGVDTFDVEPGDLIAFFTDGVIEARDRENLEWGMARLEEALISLASTERALDHVAKAVLDRVVTHVGSALSDDAALLLVRPAVSS